MKIRKDVFALLCLNALLLAVIACLIKTRAVAQTDSPAPSKTYPRAARAEQSISNPGFNWRQVESENYKTYIANLRDIGCPEETIRDIVIADVNKLFAAREKTFSDSDSWKFWQPAQPLTARLRKERQEQLQNLEKEKHLLLTELLGVQVEDDLAKTEDGEELAHLDFLSPTKRANVLKILRRFRQMKQVVYAQAEEYSTAPEWKTLRQFHDERENELARVLSPDELQEYQLCNDENAEHLRRNLLGFEPSEAEFRELFRLRKEHEDKFAFLDPADPASQEQGADQSRMEEQIKTFLGEVRYAEYRRGSNPQFKELFGLAQQFDLPPETAATLFDRHQQMQKEIARIQADGSLSNGQRETALRNFQNEIDTTLRNSLGEKGYASFQAKGIDRWLGN